MAIEVQPGFWSFLMQGTQRGIEQGQQRRSELEDAARWDKQFQLQKEQAELNRRNIEAMLMPVEMRNQMIQAGNMPGVPEMPKVPETTVSGRPGGKDITLFTPKTRSAQPVKPMTSFMSDDARAAAGMPSKANQATEQETIRLTQLRQRYASGEQLSPQELQLINQPSAEAQQLQRIGALEKPLRDMAERYVSNVMTTTQGRVNPAQMAQMATQGFDAFRTDRQMKMLNLTPDQEPYARTFFAQSVMDAWKEQEQRALQERIAGMRNTAGGTDPHEMLRELRLMTSTQQQELQREVTTGPFASVLQLYEFGFPEGTQSTDPRKPGYIMPSIVAKVEDYRTRKEALNRLMQGMATFGSNVTPENVNRLYQDFASIIGGRGSGTSSNTAPARSQGAAGKSPQLIRWEAYAQEFGEAAAKADLGVKPPR